MTYRILDIIRGTTVDGPGFRTSIYLAGCTHKCKGCHNPQSWNPDSGIEMSLDEILEIVEQEDFNVTLSGGDPLMSPEKTHRLVSAISEMGHTVWIYTGYTWEEIMCSERLRRCVALAETVVEGPFILELKDEDLRFRGSSNQRLIHPKDYLNSDGDIKSFSPENGSKDQ